MSAYEDPYDTSSFAREDRLTQVIPNLQPDKPPKPPVSPLPPHSLQKKTDIAVDGGDKALQPSPTSPKRRIAEEDDHAGKSDENLDDQVFEEIRKQSEKRRKELRELREQRRPISPGTKTLFPNLTEPPPRESPEPKELERHSPKSKSMAIPPFSNPPQLPTGPHPDMKDALPVKRELSISALSIHPPTKSSTRPPHNLTINSFVPPNTDRFQPPHSARLHQDKIEPPQRKNSLPSSIFRDMKSQNPRPADSLAQSPIAPHLRDAPSNAHNLPAMKSSAVTASPPSTTSPQSNQKLPSLGPLLEIADKTAREQQLTRQRGSSISQMGPASPFSGPPPFQSFSNHGSPVDTATSPPNFSRGFGPSPILYRRPSVASEHLYSAPLHSASTASDSHTSPDGAFSPSDTQAGTAITTPSEHSMRIGPPLYQNGPPTPHQPLSTATSPQSGVPPGYGLESTPNGHLPNGTPNGIANKLPLPTPPSAQQPSSSQPTGQYRCPFPGCSASPFQTQYLLNSHTTVHSSDRPHYCPVPGCPRGPGGMGFKRKNEMKRHGLVHDSPGYICPFCPEREHRYPRPDNLQRHVRVHHADVQTNDPRLREVLEKKTVMGRGGAARRRPRGNSLGSIGIAGVGLEV